MNQKEYTKKLKKNPAIGKLWSLTLQTKMLVTRNEIENEMLFDLTSI